MNNPVYRITNFTRGWHINIEVQKDNPDEVDAVNQFKRITSDPRQVTEVIDHDNGGKLITISNESRPFAICELLVERID